MRTKLKLALTASIAMLALTLTACEEKKKQDGTTTTATEPAAEAATQQAATQEAVVAEPKAVEVVKGSFTDTRDGKTYKTVKIGTQVWMAENLNYEVEGSMCYDNKPDNCKKYGRLYSWAPFEVCPNGWHLPSKAEWQTLIDFVGGDKVAGKKLKSTNGWNGTDDFGFSALPGGNSGFNCESDFDYSSCTIGRFEDIDYGGYWWTASEDDASEFETAYVMNMSDDREGVVDMLYTSGHLHSIRCIQD